MSAWYNWYEVWDKDCWRSGLSIHGYNLFILCTMYIALVETFNKVEVRLKSRTNIPMTGNNSENWSEIINLDFTLHSVIRTSSYLALFGLPQEMELADWTISFCDINTSFGTEEELELLVSLANRNDDYQDVNDNKKTMNNLMKLKINKMKKLHNN